MKIKITAILILIMMLFNTASLAAFRDVDMQTPVGNAIEQLSRLGIINGFSDGAFAPDKTLTRGQFAKIAVCMLGEEKTAASRKGNSVFSDVGAEHWANGYINYIAEREIINGYPDGTFGAEDTITYAQALTILIRLLGYSGEDVGYKWPDGYITKAQSIGITDGVQFGTYENITRGNAALLIYNTLLSDKKEGSDIKLLSSSSVEDVVIYGDNSLDAGIMVGNIATTKGNYKLSESSNITEDVYGRLGTLYFDSENRATAFVPRKETLRAVTLYGGALNSDSNRVEITFSENGALKTESFSGNAPLYYGGKATSLSGGIAEIEAGREALFFYNSNGTFARAYLKESTLAGPVTITSGYSQVYSSFNIVNSEMLSVIRDGRNASLADVSVFDVVYYMKGNNTLYAYTDRVSGTYEEAYPLKATITSARVGGKEYTLATRKAINKMNTSQGAFELGDRVTLLFGRNGEVVDVVDLASGGALDLAVLTQSYTRISEDSHRLGESINYVTVTLPDGSSVTYEADRDYTDYVGNVVKVSYSGNIAKLTVVKHSPIYGKFDSSVPELDGHWLSGNCAILELVKNTAEGAIVKKIELRDINVSSLTKNQVLHAETSGALKDITFLYVTDVTKSEASFGVVTEVNGSNYTVLIENRETTVKTALKLSRGSAVEIEETPDGKIPRSLTMIGTGSTIDGYSDGRIRIDGKNYVVSDYVKIYGGPTAWEFESMSIAELNQSDNINKVTLYSDRALSSGGIVRVIVVATKK